MESRRRDAHPADSGTTLLESSCVSCGACVDTCPTGAIEDKSRSATTAPPKKWTRTTCPYCGTGCEMHVGTRDDRIVQVKPALDAPVKQGPPLRQRAATPSTSSTRRTALREPMIRKGRRMAECATGTKRLVSPPSKPAAHCRERTVPQSIGVLGSARATNEENYLAQKFARVVLGTNNVDCCARVCHAPTAAGDESDARHRRGHQFLRRHRANAARSSSAARNPTENHPIVGARIKQAVLRGAQADRHRPAQDRTDAVCRCPSAATPGTNVPLLNAMAARSSRKNVR